MQRSLVLLLMGSFIVWCQAPQDPSQIISALRRGDYTEAKRLSDIQLQRFPGDVRLWTLNGLALVRLGDSPHALAAFQRALEIPTVRRSAWNQDCDAGSGGNSNHSRYEIIPKGRAFSPLWF